MVHGFLRGNPSPDGSTRLWHVTFDGANHSAWEDLGGNLSIARIVPFYAGPVLHVVVEGLRGEVWERTLPADGQPWSDWADLGGAGDGLYVIGSQVSGQLRTVTIPGPTVFTLA